MLRRLGFVDRERCSECGGECCKGMPGASMPADFGAPCKGTMRRKLKAAIGTGDWSIDSWEGDPRDGRYDLSLAYFVRPATIEGRGQVRDDSWGGQCVFLTDAGCSIFRKRPSGCRGLRPGRRRSTCTAEHSGKRDAAVAWIPYHDVLSDVKDQL